MKVELPRAGRALQAVMRVMPRDAEWTVKGIKQSITSTNTNITPKEVDNAIGYLQRRGYIERLGYGRYLLVADCEEPVTTNGQRRWVSFVEVNLNAGSGFLISIVVNYHVLPLFGFDASWSQALGRTSIFVVISILRSYLWRRLFNWLQERN